MNEQTLVINDLLAFLSCKYHMISKDDLIKSIKDFYSDSDIEDAKDTFFAALPPKKSSKLCDKVKDKDHLDGLYESFRKIPEKYLPLFACKNINNIPQLELAAVTEDSILEDDCAPFNFRTEQRNMKLQIKKITTVINEIKDHLNDLATESIYNDEENNPTPTVYLQSLHNDDIHFEDKIDIKPSLNSEAVAYDENGDTNIEESIYLGNSDKEYSFDPSSKGEEKSIEISSSEMIENEDILNTISWPKLCLKNHDLIDSTEDLNSETQSDGDIIFSEESSSREDYSEHRKQCSYACRKCAFISSDLMKYNSHLMSHGFVSYNDDFSCSLCCMKSADSEVIKIHLHSHNWTRPYRCSLCHFKSNDESNFRRHAGKHTECKGPSQFECQKCGKICGTRNALEKHKQMHKRSFDLECEHCHRTFPHKSALTQHLRSHIWNKDYGCGHCGLFCYSQSALDSHMKIHSKEDPFTCHLCSSKFLNRGRLRRHILSKHSQEKPFKCEFCSEVFTYKHTFLVHRKSHLRGLLHNCKYCNKKFKCQSYLKVHYAIHEGRRPFTCGFCDFESASKATLKKHESVHDPHPLSCTTCQFITMYPKELNKHKLTHASETIVDKMIVILND